MTSDYVRTVRYMIKCCYRYYVAANPCMGDTSYDKLVHAVQEIEAANPGDTLAMSPTQKIWGDSSSQYPAWAKDEPTPEETVVAHTILNAYMGGKR